MERLVSKPWEVPKFPTTLSEMKDDMTEKKEDLKFIVTEEAFGNRTSFYYVRHLADTLPAGTYEPSENRGLVYLKAKINNEPVEISPDSLAAKIADEIRVFTQSKEKYVRFKLPHKRGYLLHGAPGCGKSALIREIQRDFAKTGGIVLLMNYYTVAAYNDVRQAEPERPIMVVCEDVDSMRVVSEENLLEFLDGQTTLDNAIFVATTNKMGSIARRLTERPSRIDRVIEITPPTDSDRAFYLKNFNLDKETMDRVLKMSSGLTFAQLKEMVILHTIYNTPIEEAAKRMQNLGKKSIVERVGGIVNNV